MSHIEFLNICFWEYKYSFTTKLKVLVQISHEANNILFCLLFKEIF